MSATLIAYNINIETAQNRIRITYKRSVAVCALLLFLPAKFILTYANVVREQLVFNASARYLHPSLCIRFAPRLRRKRDREFSELPTWAFSHQVLLISTYLKKVRELLIFSASVRCLHPSLPIWFASRLHKKSELALRQVTTCHHFMWTNDL